MNKNVLVSVIVPVFNAKQYLSKLVNSVLGQTHTNFEMILVDDGSTDGSSVVLDEISKSDARIKVIHKKRGGVSSSRNVGINAAKGEYIIFIDADDWVESNHIEYLLTTAFKFNVPVVYGTRHYFDNKIDEKVESKEYTVFNDQIVEWIYNGHIYMAVWNRIYNLKFLNDHNIRFNENIWYSEGMHFNMQCLAHLKEVAVAPKKTYYYVSNPNSAMRKCFKLENELNALKSLEEQKQFINLENIRVKIAHTYHLMVVHENICRGIVKNKCFDKHSKQFKESIKFIRKHWLIPLKTDIGTKQKIHWFLICMFPSIFGKHILWER